METSRAKVIADYPAKYRKLCPNFHAENWDIGAHTEAMPDCPFYGCRWPERTLALKFIGGNECGLDFDSNGPCVMEKQGRTPSYFDCSLVQSKRHFVQLLRRQVLFAINQEKPKSLAEWEEN